MDSIVSVITGPSRQATLSVSGQISYTVVPRPSRPVEATPVVADRKPGANAVILTDACTCNKPPGGGSTPGIGDAAAPKGRAPETWSGRCGRAGGAPRWLRDPVSRLIVISGAFGLRRPCRAAAR